MKLTLGAQKLNAYLIRQKLSGAEFATKCGLHRTQIHAYRKGRTQPGIRHAVTIQFATRRAVLLADWAKPPIEGKDRVAA